MLYLNKLNISILLFITVSSIVLSSCLSLSSSGAAKLQWIHWKAWGCKWDLQAIWGVIQHTETSVSVCVFVPRMCVCACSWVLAWVRAFLCGQVQQWNVMCLSPNRGEFDSEGTPDLNKDVYLQDIHCVSSLCKAYFRELPNPLLTYQLYDKYAVSTCFTW